ncbi:FMN reductase [Phytoactinopolyspora halotolerans]|uniref:FMN reductase n=1 Tax=Phytoactinopolyspora halotolerans TaxID=1981512 RepID=A0A6L9SJ87_9ACTN|nr:FMN reductase [Phytoactinopolyspora halotolerans]NEE04351.1 FMN reductase [Phytoactinopolyspora halotolerans]
MRDGDVSVVALSAGLRQPSSTRMLADRLGQATLSALDAHGVTATAETVEVREIAHDVVNAMLTGFPAGGLPEALEKVTHASGLIAVTPVFGTSYSGLFKSFMDVLEPDSLTGMPVLLGATGGTPRHSLALDYAMRPLFAYLHADAVSTTVFAATDDWAGDGDTENPLPERIERAGRELAERIMRTDRTGPADLYDDVPSLDQMLRP